MQSFFSVCSLQKIKYYTMKILVRTDLEGTGSSQMDPNGPKLTQIDPDGPRY